MSNTISPSQAAQLRLLYRELPSLIWVATNLIRTEAVGLSGDDLHRFREADAKVHKVMDQIRQIAG